MPLMPSSTPEIICKKIQEKSKYSDSDKVKRFLYIGICNQKNNIKTSQILRQLKPGENVYDLEQSLKENKIEHEYYTLPEELYKTPREVEKVEYDEKFFKKGKWEKSGELLKSTKKDDSKPCRFNKRQFYLGRDLLYYMKKSGT